MKHRKNLNELPDRVLVQNGKETVEYLRQDLVESLRRISREKGYDEGYKRATLLIK